MGAPLPLLPPCNIYGRPPPCKRFLQRCDLESRLPPSIRPIDAAPQAVLSDLRAACRERPQGIVPRSILRGQESRHGLPALPLVLDHRARGANGSWLPAVSVDRRP